MKAVRRISALLILTISLGFLQSCVVVYAPRAERAALQIHEQIASNMVVNETVPIEPRIANEVTGIVGASIRDNEVKGVETTTTIKAK